MCAARTRLLVRWLPASADAHASSLATMGSIKERMAALQAASDASAAKPAAPQRVGSVRVEPTGDAIHSGWLRKTGTGLMSAIATKRWCVLYSDPALHYYEDDAREKYKGSVALGGVAVSHADDCMQIVVSAETVIKFKATSARR